MTPHNKKPFLLRLSPQVFEALQQWANDEFRSANAHIEYLLLESLKKAGRKPAKKPSTPPTQDTSHE